jgi:G3E family GTPase
MRTTVVTGLLGAGKTSFIRNFLKDRTEKAVVLVNDFGQAGIDGEIISAGGVEAIELPSGCVCCTLKFDLITSIQKVVAQFAPDHLLIEPSGVASPSGVLEALASAQIAPPSVVGIVDAVEFAELYRSGMYGSFFREQIESSDVILVNKADIAGEDAIIAAERLIEEINPLAVRLRTVHAMLDHPLPAGERRAYDGRHEGDAPSETLSWQRDHCVFETLSFKLPDGMGRAAIEGIFHDLAAGKYGTIARAKALVATSEGPFRLDMTFGKVDAVPFSREITDSRLVVIGNGLRQGDLQQSIPARQLI